MTEKKDDIRLSDVGIRNFNKTTLTTKKDAVDPDHDKYYDLDQMRKELDEGGAGWNPKRWQTSYKDGSDGVWKFLDRESLERARKTLTNEAENLIEDPITERRHDLELERINLQLNHLDAGLNESPEANRELANQLHDLREEINNLDPKNATKHITDDEAKEDGGFRKVRENYKQELTEQLQADGYTGNYQYTGMSEEEIDAASELQRVAMTADPQAIQAYDELMARQQAQHAELGDKGHQTLIDTQTQLDHETNLNANSPTYLDTWAQVLTQPQQPQQVGPAHQFNQNTLDELATNLEASTGKTNIKLHFDNLVEPGVQAQDDIQYGG